MMTVQPYSSARQDEWDEFVKQSRGTFLHKRQFMDYHADRFPDASAMIYDRGKLVAVLPATKGGQEVSSHAGLTYGGLLHTGLTSGKVLKAFDTFNEHYFSLGYVAVVYKPIPFIYSSYPGQEDLYALFRLNAQLVARALASTVPIEARLRFTEARRSGLRKAKRVGCTVELSNSYNEVWEVLEAALQDRHGARPTHSAAEMLLLKDRFPDHIRLFVARIEGEIGAACVVFDTGAVSHAQYITSTVLGLRSGALDALFDYLINTICPREKTKFFDFGTSTEEGGRILNEGLVFQKEGFGGRGVTYDTYRYSLPACRLADV